MLFYSFVSYHVGLFFFDTDQTIGEKNEVALDSSKDFFLPLLTLSHFIKNSNYH